MGIFTVTTSDRSGEAAWAGGKWVATLSTGHLGTEDLSRPARSSGVSTGVTQATFVLPQLRPIRVFGFGRVNFSRNARTRWEAYYGSTLSSSVVAYSTGWVDVFPAAYDTSKIPFEHPSWWDGKPTQEEIDAYQSHWAVVTDAAVNIQSGQFWLDDPSNTAGYLQIGRAFVAEAVQPTFNMDWGAQIRWVPVKPRSEVADGGAEYFGSDTKARQTSFTVSDLSPDEMMQGLWEAQRVLGLKRPSMLIFDPADVTHRPRLWYVARLTSMEPVTWDEWESNSVRMTWKEVL